MEYQKTDKPENNIYQQINPGSWIVVDCIVPEKEIQQTMNRSQIIPPYSVSENFHTCLSRSGYEQVHEHERWNESDIPHYFEILGTQSFCQVY
jgi:hypothetical protein